MNYSINKYNKLFNIIVIAIVILGIIFRLVMLGIIPGQGELNPDEA